jgi:hypothetical protein
MGDTRHLATLENIPFAPPWNPRAITIQQLHSAHLHLIPLPMCGIIPRQFETCLPLHPPRYSSPQQRYLTCDSKTGAVNKCQIIWFIEESNTKIGSALYLSVTFHFDSCPYLHILLRKETSRSWARSISQNRRTQQSSDTPLRPQDIVAEVIEKWNMKFFMRRGTRALLCQEYLPGFPDSPAFAIYLVDWTSSDGLPFRIVDRFNAVPEGLERIDIFDPPTLNNARSRILGRTSIFSSRHPTEGRVHFGVSLRNLAPAQEQPTSHGSSRRTRSRSSSISPESARRQGDRVHLSQRSRNREPSPRNRRPRRSRSSSRSSRSRSRSPSRWPDTVLINPAPHPGLSAVLHGPHNETAHVAGPSIRDRRWSRSPTNLEERPYTYNPPTLPDLPPRHHAVGISPGPPVIIHPPTTASTSRSRSRPRSALSPLSLALRSSIRRRDSIDTPYQSDTLSVAHHRRDAIDAPAGDARHNIDLDSHLEAFTPLPDSESDDVHQASHPIQGSSSAGDAIVGPWTRDISSLHNLTMIQFHS